MSAGAGDSEGWRTGSQYAVNRLRRARQRPADARQGERDDLCTSIQPHRKTHPMQTGVGHCGVFSGKRWSQLIYPRVRDMIHASAG